jgi:hypothetical protein
MAWAAAPGAAGGGAIDTSAVPVAARRSLREGEMFVHGRASALRVVRAHRVIDRPVHLRGFFQVAPLVDGLAPLFVEQCRNHLHQRGEDRVPARRGNRPMEANVVHEKCVRVVG